MPTLRQARVGEMVKRELAEIFLREMRDPRLATLTVTDVEVARDFTSAKVFVSILGDEAEKAQALKALHGASGYLRGQLGHRIELRSVPVLQFRYDTGIERGARMFELLRSEELERSGAGETEDSGAEFEAEETQEDSASGDAGSAGSDGSSDRGDS